ncbi:coiled-coil domain-containing protein 73 isoform X2 [Mastacembelus armatus]|uniref:coiled-coil domain-containing protein 73 isoform X2 n=1 Tax=Mastacembelus armatus TaxID=205130 RepID=UPI000E45A955|nr:coiled-coil domain-containing protein 73 isoform X2 [Mastacembelus armatus]
MDLSADSGTLSTHTIVGGPVLEQEQSLSGAHCQTESGGTILLQLLEFKKHLLEAVEELHIRRDAEARFEDQLSKLVLEKQELEWEKESLQHKMETMANQHTESLTNVKKQFQAKIRDIEEQKGKYQVSAELKDKEINNLKEELKSLQLLKYNLEKKSSELEQKLALQSRSKDSHLNQLGEVEKRFNALSRQCALVKQAHEKLEQNVDEAMRINKKLFTANEKQEATIVSLKKELEEVSKNMIQAKMTSGRHNKAHSPTGKEQHVLQLQQKMNMEIMKSLQYTQELLLTQTQTISRVELELQTQREKYQALKQEHEVMREKSKAAEDKVAQLMESYTASKICWDREKTVFQDHIRSEQQELQAVKEAYNELHQQQSRLSSRAEVQTQHIFTSEVRDSSPRLSLSAKVIPTSVEEVRGGEPLNEPMSSSELPNSGNLLHLASCQTKNPDCLEDTRALTKLVATGATGGQEGLIHHQQSQCKQPLGPSSPLTCPLSTSDCLGLRSLSGTDNDSNRWTTYISNSNRSESDPNGVSDSICTTSSVSDNILLISQHHSTMVVLSQDHRCVDARVSLLSKEEKDEKNTGINEKKLRLKDNGKLEKVNRKKEESHAEQLWNREEFQRRDVKERKSVEKKGTLIAQATGSQKDNQGSAEDAGTTRNPEAQMRDRMEREETDGVEERGEPALHTSETPETQIQAQTTDMTSEKSNTQQFTDFMDTEPPPAVSEPMDCSQNLSQKVTERDADSTHANEGYGIETHGQLLQTLYCDDSQGPKLVIQKNLCHGDVRTQDAESFNQLPKQIHQEEKPSCKSASEFNTKLSEPLNQSNICSSTTNGAQTDGTVSIQGLETTTAQTEPSNPSNTTSDMKQRDEIFDRYMSEEYVLVRPVLVRPLVKSEQENGPLETDGGGGGGGGRDTSACENRDGQSNADTQENSADDTVQEPMENCSLKNDCVGIMMDAVSLAYEVEPRSCQDRVKTDKHDDARCAKTSKSDLGSSDHSVYTSDESPETGHLKCYEQLPGKDVLLDNSELSLPSNKCYKSFDWDSTVRSRTTSQVSVLQQFVQAAKQNTSGSGGHHKHPPRTTPMFLKSKYSKVPLVITRTSDLLNAFSVSGTAASSRTHQQGEWKAMGENCRETTAADTESRPSLSISSFPASASSSTVSRLSWQATPGSSRASSSAAGLTSESDWEHFNSQESEDQHSSLRAQISKIEQFLNEERLCLTKRRRIDN